MTGQATRGRSTEVADLLIDDVQVTGPLDVESDDGVPADLAVQLVVPCLP